MKKFFQNIKFKKVSLTTLAFALVVSGFLVWGNKIEAQITSPGGISVDSPTSSSLIYAKDGDASIPVQIDVTTDATGSGKIRVEILPGIGDTTWFDYAFTVAGTNNDIAINVPLNSGISEGTYDLKVSAQQPAGTGVVQTITVVDVVVIDNTAPTTPTILTPNASGLYLAGGATYAITWTPTTDTNLGATPIKIEYSPLGTFADTVVLTAGTENDGTYDWTVPASDLNTAKIKITATDLAGNTATSTSANAFTIDNTHPAIQTTTLLTPSAAAIELKGGASYNITWTFGDIADTNLAANPITIQYAGDGSTYSDVATGEANDGTYTWTVPSSDLGTAKIKIIATDLAGNTSEDTSGNAFLIDSTNPTVDAGSFANPIKIATAPTGASATDAGSGIKTVAWTSSSAPVGGTLVFSDSTNITSTLAGSAVDGVYVALVTVTDDVDNVATDTVTFTWDTTAPTGYTISIDQSYINNTNKTAASFTFAGAEVGATYNYSIDDSTPGSPVTGTGTIATATDQITGINISSLNDDTITFTVTLTDPAGNAGSGTTDTVVKETVVPVVTSGNITVTGQNGVGGEFKKGDTVVATWTNTGGDANADIASVTIDFSEFGGGATATATDSSGIWSASYTLPTDVNLTGKKVSVTATDTAGNVTTTADDTTYTVDTEEPDVTIASVTGTPTNGNIAVTVVFNAAVTGFDDTDVSVTNGAVEGFTADSGTNYHFNINPTDGASVAVTIQILASKAIDIVGNNNTASNILSYTSDTVAPTLPISGIVGATIQGASDTITLTFDGSVEPNDGTWSSNEFDAIESPNGTAKTLVGATFSPSTGATTTLAITLAEDSTNLETYLRNGNIITVKPASNKIKDASGNFVANSEVVGTTAITGDVVAPTVALTYSPDRSLLGLESVMITATFSELMDETTAPRIAIDTQGDGDLAASAYTTMTKTSPMVWTFDWQVPGGHDDVGIATVSVTGTDLAGNANATASNNTRVITSPDSIVTGFTAGSITTTGATLTVTTSENATCKYATEAATFANMTQMGTTGGTTHTQALTGLTEGTKYTNYRVRCSISSNAVSDLEYVEFTTNSVAGTGSFGVVSKTMTKMTGTADDSYANGWEWTIRMTLPSDQNRFALKFNDWVSGSNTMAAGGNMEYYSEQISSGAGSSASPIAITDDNTYPDRVTVLTDVDPNLDGIQTDIHIKVKIPSATPAGSYGTGFKVLYE